MWILSRWQYLYLNSQFYCCNNKVVVVSVPCIDNSEWVMYTNFGGVTTSVKVCTNILSPDPPERE